MRISLAELFLVIASSTLVASPSLAQNHDWQLLKAVPEEQQVRISLRGGTSHKGILQGVGENTITVDGKAFNKDDVQRVWLKQKSKRAKHVLIGAGIGGGTGLGMGTAVDAQCSQNSIICTGPYGKLILTPVFGVVGAGVGALLPAHGWRELYRTE